METHLQYPQPPTLPIPPTPTSTSTTITIIPSEYHGRQPEIVLPNHSQLVAVVEAVAEAALPQETTVEAEAPPAANPCMVGAEDSNRGRRPIIPITTPMTCRYHRRCRIDHNSRSIHRTPSHRQIRTPILPRILIRPRISLPIRSPRLLGGVGSRRH